MLASAHMFFVRCARALVFDGKDDYVEVMHSPTLYFPSITVMAWVNFTKFPDAGAYGGNPVSMIVAKGTRDNLDGWFGLQECWKPEVFRFSFRENNQWYGADGTTHLVEGEWYHVAGTYDGSVLKLYVNGVLEDEEIVNVTRTNNIRNFQIGASRMPSFEYWTDGIIDEVRIYNRALAAQEVMEHYAGLPP